MEPIGVAPCDKEENIVSADSRPSFKTLLGFAHDEAHEIDKAEEEFKKAIAASPGMPDLNFALGYLYWREKRFDQADRSCGEAGGRKS